MTWPFLHVAHQSLLLAITLTQESLIMLSRQYRCWRGVTRGYKHWQKRGALQRWRRGWRGCSAVPSPRMRWTACSSCWPSSAPRELFASSWPL